MDITVAQLLLVMPQAKLRAVKFIDFINTAMKTAAIYTPLRQAAFLSQIAEESEELLYTKELWGPTEDQKEYEPPSAKATALGNTQVGDGFKFRGRGLIQITGRANYVSMGAYMHIDCVTRPELLETPQYAALSAAYYWLKHNINNMADIGDLQNVTRLVNGGLNGYDRRLAYYDLAKQALGI